MSTHTTKVPGRIPFIAGCVTLLLFSTVHMIPMFFDLFVEPTNPAEIEAKRAMAAVTVDIGPFHTHLGKLHQLLSTSYSALIFFVATLNLVALPAVTAPAPYGRLRQMAAVNVIFLAILLLTSLIFRFPPPAAFALIAGVFFMTAFIRAGRKS